MGIDGSFRCLVVTSGEYCIGFAFDSSAWRWVIESGLFATVLETCNLGSPLSFIISSHFDYQNNFLTFQFSKFNLPNSFLKFTFYKISFLKKNSTFRNSIFRIIFSYYHSQKFPKVFQKFKNSKFND